MSLVGVDLAICAFCLCFVRRCDHVEVTVTSYSPPPLVSLRVLFIQTNVPFSPLSIESNREGEHYTTLPFSSPSVVARRQGQSGPVRTFSIDLRPELAAYQAALFSGFDHTTRIECGTFKSHSTKQQAKPCKKHYRESRFEIFNDKTICRPASPIHHNAHLSGGFILEPAGQPQSF